MGWKNFSLQIEGVLIKQLFFFCKFVQWFIRKVFENRDGTDRGICGIYYKDHRLSKRQLNYWKENNIIKWNVVYSNSAL